MKKMPDGTSELGELPRVLFVRVASYQKNMAVHSFRAVWFFLGVLGSIRRVVRSIVAPACMLATVLKMLPFGENVKVLFGVSLICAVSYMPFALQGEQARQAKDALCAC